MFKLIKISNGGGQKLNRIDAAQECDARNDEQGTKDWSIYKILRFPPENLKL